MRAASSSSASDAFSLEFMEEDEMLNFQSNRYRDLCSLGVDRSSFRNHTDSRDSGRVKRISFQRRQTLHEKNEAFLRRRQTRNFVDYFSLPEQLEKNEKKSVESAKTRLGRKLKEKL